jgi:hypothetical protein
MKKSIMITPVLLTCMLSASVKPQTPSKAVETDTLKGKAVSIVISRREPGPTPKDSLKNARAIYVTSSSLLVGRDVIEDKLKKRREFEALGLVIIRDANAADLIIHVAHDLFTMYTYTVIDPHSQIVVASGKLSSLGGTVAGKVAKRFMKQMVEARVP